MSWLSDLFGSNIGDQMRGYSTQQQRAIDLGMGQIAAMFGPTPTIVGTNPVTSGPINYKQTYYGPETTLNPYDYSNSDFTDWAKTHFLNLSRDLTLSKSSKPGVASGATKALQTKWQNFMKQLKGTGALFSTGSSGGGFDPAFYQGRTDAYTNWAMPQLSQQQTQAQNQLAYSMADRGLLNSTAAQALAGSLDQQGNLQREAVANQGVSLAQQLQQQVAGEQAQLQSQLLASVSPATTTSQALQSAANFQAPSVFTPIGNLFSNWASLYLANNINNNASQYPYMGTGGSVNAGAIPGN